jgi:hypothetical protein
MKIANFALRLSLVVLVPIAILGGLDWVIDRSEWEPPPAVAGIVAVPPVPIDPPRPTFKPCDRLPDDLAGDCWMRADEREARRIEGELTRLKNEAVRLADEIWRTLKRQANIGGGDG